MAYPETFAPGVDTSFSTKLNTNFGLFTGTTVPTNTLIIKNSITNGTDFVHPYRCSLEFIGDGDSCMGGRIGAASFGTTEPPTIITYRARGSLASPTVLNAGDTIFQIAGFTTKAGIANTAWALSAAVIAITPSQCSSTSTPSYITFNTTPVGATAAAEAARITQDKQLVIQSGEPLGKITLSTSDASGGNDGDLWLKY